MATGKKGGKRSRGPRLFLVIGLIGFFVAATGVVTRRIFGISQAKALRALQSQREAAEAARVKLEVEIREASSRARLGPIAERRLNMYVPADSQVIILPRETRPNP
jgi:cell division protein FtsL